MALTETPRPDSLTRASDDPGWILCACGRSVPLDTSGRPHVHTCPTAAPELILVPAAADPGLRAYRPMHTLSLLRPLW